MRSSDWVKILRDINWKTQDGWTTQFISFFLAIKMWRECARQKTESFKLMEIIWIIEPKSKIFSPVACPSHGRRHTFQSGKGPSFRAKHMAGGYGGMEGEEKGGKEAWRVRDRAKAPKLAEEMLYCRFQCQLKQRAHTHTHTVCRHANIISRSKFSMTFTLSHRQLQ